MTLVGEIGIDRDTYLYRLMFWEIVMIRRGYTRRQHDLWSATRWQTYQMMCVSGADMKKAGIYTPRDLIKFPWENEREEQEETGNMPTAAEIEAMREEMRRINAGQANP